MVSKKIKLLLGITGGVAAYKSLFLVRELMRADIEVKVILTENGKQFVTPLSAESLSNNPVYDDMFARRESYTHISLRDWADVMVIAPATANSIAKIATGIADDLLSTVALSCTKPRFVAPAMNVQMWESVVVQRNIATISSDGWQIIGPASGMLGCGVEGAGRMVEVDEIVRQILVLREQKKFDKLVVTAGATRQPIDAVRFISNWSTGKMGTAIAEVATHYFNEVVLVHGALSVPVPAGVRTVKAETTDAMLRAVSVELENASGLVMAAAVSDFTPHQVASGKIKKGDSSELEIKLVAAPDILRETISLRENILSAGFAMESESLEENSLAKLQAKKLDFILGNPLLEEGAGFGTDTNRVVYFDRWGKKEVWPTQAKKSIAKKLLQRMMEKMSGG